MRQPLNAPVSVLLKFDHRARQVVLKKILFDGTEYKISRVGLHYTERDGRALRHIFCVAAGESCFFKLVMNSETLQWTCEEMRNYANELVGGVAFQPQTFDDSPH